MSRNGSSQLFCHIPVIQICHTSCDKAGDMSRTVTAIFTAVRRLTIDYNAGEACDVVMKVFLCIKIALDMFVTVLTINTVIFRSDLKGSLHSFVAFYRSNLNHFLVLLLLFTIAIKNLFKSQSIDILVRIHCILIIGLLIVSRKSV